MARNVRFEGFAIQTGTGAASGSVLPSGRFEQIVFFDSHGRYIAVIKMLVEQLHSRMFCWKLSRQLRLGLAYPGVALVDT
jgi:hypothetical protein